MAQPLKRIGIIGAGQMGNGIAHVCALAGYDVTLNDLSEERLDAAFETMKVNLTRQASRGQITADQMDAALARIARSTSLDDFGQVDLAIEAATEDEQVKRKIFQALCPKLGPNAMVATNTSSISITRLAASTDRPERFIGLHFMNPVPVMKLVEIIRGIATEDETFQAALDLVKAIGKTSAYAEDFPAFIVNRILLPMINEAVYTLYEGVGNVEAIDTAMRLGANHPMGPLQLADFIGLDTCLSVMQVLYDGLADSKYRPCPLLVKYVEAGWLGRKANRGFYDYRGEKAGADTMIGRGLLAAALLFSSAMAAVPEREPRAFPKALPGMAPWTDVPAMKGVEFGGPIPESGPPDVNGWADQGGTYVADDMYLLSLFSTDTQVGVAITTLVKRLPGGEPIYRIERMVAAPKPGKDAYPGSTCATILNEGAQGFPVVAVVDPSKAPEGGFGSAKAASAALIVDLRTGGLINLDPGTVTCDFEEP